MILLLSTSTSMPQLSPQLLHSWFVRFVDECQREGVIQNPGNAAELVPMGVSLTYFVLLEWCAAKGAYSLKDRAYKEMERFYNVRDSLRGIYENI